MNEQGRFQMSTVVIGGSVMTILVCLSLIAPTIGIPALLGCIAASGYFYLRVKEIELLVNFGSKKLAVISMAIVGLLRYLFIGAGLIVTNIYFHSSPSFITYVVAVVIIWFINVWLTQRR